MDEYHVATSDYINQTPASINGVTTSMVEMSENVTSLLSGMTSPLHVFERHTWTSFLAVHSPAALYVDRALTPLWYVVGLAGNLLSAIVWSDRKMRRHNSSAVYLVALSVSDFVFLVLHILQELKYAWWVRTLEYPVVCETYFLLVLVAQYLSPTLVLGFTVERFIAVCLPFSKERWCTSRRASKVVAGFVCLCLSLCSIQAYFWTYNHETKQCQVRSEVTDGGELSLWTVWSWSTEMLIFLIVPAIIFIFNILVIKEVHRMTSRCREGTIVIATLPTSLKACGVCAISPLPCSGSTQHNGCAVSDALCRDEESYATRPTNISLGSSSVLRSSGGSNGTGWGVARGRGLGTAAAVGQGGAATTVMLLSVSFYVIMTTLPATLVYVLHSQFPEGDMLMTDVEISRDATWRQYLAYMTTRKIVEEICLSHYACNVFLYLITGEKFRESLSRLLRCRSRFGSGSGRRLWSSGGGDVRGAGGTLTTMGREYSVTGFRTISPKIGITHSPSARLDTTIIDY